MSAGMTPLRRRIFNHGWHGSNWDKGTTLTEGF